MTYEEQIEQVINALNYLVAEGLAVEDGNGNYRVKTDSEIEEELKKIYDHK